MINQIIEKVTELAKNDERLMRRVLKENEQELGMRGATESMINDVVVEVINELLPWSPKNPKNMKENDKMLKQTSEITKIVYSTL